MSDQSDATKQTSDDARNAARALTDAGDTFYTNGQGKEAIEHWEHAARADRTWALPWRRLAMAYFNATGEKVAAKGAYQRAFRLEPTAEILQEADALLRAIQVAPHERLEQFEKNSDLVRGSDALRVTAAEALNLVDRFEHAKGLLLERPFAGSEAAAAATQYRRAEIALLRQSLWRGDDTRPAWEALLTPPPAFANTPPDPAERAELHYWLGTAQCKAHNFPAAHRHWEKATIPADHPPTTENFFAALALRERGNDTQAESVFTSIETCSSELAALAEKMRSTAGEPSRKLEIRFDEARQLDIESAFFQALARYGLHEKKIARRLLGDVLRDDPNHALATDFMRWLDWQM